MNVEWTAREKERDSIMYEYVPKNEYRPVRKDLDEVILKVHKYMKKQFKITFQDRLIGSGGRHLITRQISGNKGFDFDYNFIIKKPSSTSNKSTKAIKKQFMEALTIAIKGTQYDCPQDSTSAITIKVVDKQNKKILHSCDFAIVYYSDNDNFDGYYYLKNNKQQRYYSFEQRNYSSNLDEKIREIGDWESIKSEYLKLKNNNKDSNKHSFDLYAETVNNVYNQKFNKKGKW